MNNIIAFRHIIIFLIATVLFSCDPSGNKNGPLGNKDSASFKAKAIDTLTKGTLKKLPEGNKNSELKFLYDFEGKYPNSINLLDNVIIKQRLQKMLGDKYDFMKSIWEVETPVEIKNGLFYSWGMQAHSGGNPEAILMADIKKNVLYVGLRDGDKVNVYSEDGSTAPPRLLDWEIK